MSIAAFILRMSELGASADMIALAVAEIEAHANKDAERRSRAAEKKARQRAAKRGQSGDGPGTEGGQGGDTPPSSPSQKNTPPHPPKKTHSPTSPHTSKPADADFEGTPSPKPAKRGSRVDDFAPDLVEATRLGLSERRASDQAAKFLDYWRAVPGAKGLKLDWPATFRNWVRSEIERNGAGDGARGVSRATGNPRHVDTDPDRPPPPGRFAVQAERRRRDFARLRDLDEGGSS